MSVLII